MRSIIVGVMISLGLGFGAGYFYGKSMPQIIRLQRSVQLQEIRDDYYHKCEMEDITTKPNGTIEQKWSCSKIKVYLINKFLEKTFEQPS